MLGKTCLRCTHPSSKTPPWLMSLYTWAGRTQDQVQKENNHCQLVLGAGWEKSEVSRVLAVALALQYQSWTAGGNMSLQMLNFPPGQKQAVWFRDWYSAGIPEEKANSSSRRLLSTLSPKARASSHLLGSFSQLLARARSLTLTLHYAVCTHLLRSNSLHLASVLMLRMPTALWPCVDKTTSLCSQGGGLCGCSVLTSIHRPDRETVLSVT